MRVQLLQVYCERDSAGGVLSFHFMNENIIWSNISPEIDLEQSSHHLCSHADSLNVMSAHSQFCCKPCCQRGSAGGALPFHFYEGKQCPRRLCSHLCSLRVCFKPYNLVRMAGRYLSIFMEDITTWSNSSFRSRCEMVLSPAVQPCRLVLSFVASHVADVVRQVGRDLSIFMTGNSI